MLEDCHIIKVSLHDVANGPGIRTTVWVSGCSHQCDGCHNPETWKWKQGTKLTQELIEKILKACEEDVIAGLTLTGGDPLFIKNRAGITQLCKAFKTRYPDKTIWLWTGYLYEEIEDLEVLQYLDVIVDGKYVECMKDVSLPYAGSRNQRVINLRNRNASFI